MPDSGGPSEVAGASNGVRAHIGDHDLVQNAALGAVTLWMFVLAYTITKPGGPSVAETLLVLPIAFHEHSRHWLMRRRPAGGLFVAVAKDRALFAGLQARLMDMTPLSWRSLNVALAADLIRYDPEGVRFTAKRTTPPYQLNRGEIRELFHTVKRLAKWMAEIEKTQLLGLLRVSF